MVGEGGILLTDDEDIVNIAPCFAGYVKPLHLNPIYTEKRAYVFKHYTDNVKYGKWVYPVAEKLHETDLINTIVCRPPATLDDVKDIVLAIHKIIENKNELI